MFFFTSAQTPAALNFSLSSLISGRHILIVFV